MLRSYRDFIFALTEIGPRWPWFFDVERCIRTQTPDGMFCDPLTALAAMETNVVFDLNDYRRAGLEVGLHPEAADRIVGAIDLMGSYNAHIRSDLIEAIGLAEIFATEGRWNDLAYHNAPYPHAYDVPAACGGVLSFTVRAAGEVARSKCITKPPLAALLLPPNMRTVPKRAARSAPFA